MPPQCHNLPIWHVKSATAAYSVNKRHRAAFIIPKNLAFLDFLLGVERKLYPGNGLRCLAAENSHFSILPTRQRDCRIKEKGIVAANGPKVFVYGPCNAPHSDSGCTTGPFSGCGIAKRATMTPKRCRLGGTSCKRRGDCRGGSWHCRRRGFVAVALIRWLGNLQLETQLRRIDFQQQRATRLTPQVANRFHQIVQPPSTARVWPVI